jgi:hypothetical protein
VKIGDLVKMKRGCGAHHMTYDEPGFVMRIDKQYYGASTAYKVSKVERGKCIRSNMVDFIGVTADGIRDRVMVLWPGAGYTYEESTKLDVVSEGG